VSNGEVLKESKGSKVVVLNLLHKHKGHQLRLCDLCRELVNYVGSVTQSNIEFCLAVDFKLKDIITARWRKTLVNLQKTPVLSNPKHIIRV